LAGIIHKAKKHLSIIAVVLNYDISGDHKSSFRKI